MIGRKSFAGDECPIAVSADAVGDVWSLLILRDVFAGRTRFDRLQAGLGIAPNMLARRLGSLIEAGVLQKRPYQLNPVRHEYLLTERGRDFHPVVVALFAVGNARLDPADKHLLMVDRETGAEVDPVLVDRRTGRPIDHTTTGFAPGPAAGPGMPARLIHQT